MAKKATTSADDVDIKFPEAGSRYSPEERVKAVYAYMLTGDSEKAAAQLGIPGRTIRFWKQQEWWGKAIVELRQQKNDELDSALTNVAHACLEEIEDRIKNGDEVVFANGKKARRKVSAKDAAVIHGITFEKRQLLRNQPTAIAENSESERLKRLEGRFADMARQIEARTITGECEPPSGGEG